MGVFTTTKTYRLGLNLMSQWWLSGASIDLDFDNARYYDSSLAAGVQSLAPLNSYLSISRASTGYAKTAEGTLTNFGNDTLRVTSAGLLIEDARTNIARYSQTFDTTTTWNTTNVTITADQMTAPDGTTTADKITVNGSSNDFTGATGTDGLLSFTGGLAYTVSLYVKPGSGNTWITVRISDFSANVFGKWFNLSGAGSVGSNNNLGDGSITTASVEALGNSWYRVIMTGQFTSTHNAAIAIYPAVSADSSNSTTNGHFMYLWGVQIEQGAFASSYIPTSGASATRAADLVTATGTLNTVLCGSAMSIVADAITNQSMAAYTGTFLAQSGEGNPLVATSGNSGLASQNRAGTLLNATLGNSRTWDIGAKAGLSINASGRSLVGGGGTVTTDSATSTYTLFIVGNILFGYIRRFTVFNSRLADATLQSLTAP